MQISIHIDVSLDRDPGLVSDFFGAFASLATDLLVESLVETWQKSCATRQHNVVVKVDL
jgi:hypothetical protein